MIEIEEEIKQRGESKERLRLLRVATSEVKFSPYYDHARELARRLSIWGMRSENPEKYFHVISGGGPGIMEATNRGAKEGGGKSIGLGISLPFEQSINKYCDPELSFEFQYFFIRKYWFLYHAKAILVFPGGFGTMDELFEMLTLIQTQKVEKKVPIILFGKEFWEKLINFEVLLEWGTISPEDCKLFTIVETVDEAYDRLTKSFENCDWLKTSPRICDFL